MYAVKPVIADEMTPKDWGLFFELSRVIHSERRRKSKFITEEEFRQRKTSLLKNLNFSIFLLEENGRLAGWMGYLSQIDSSNHSFGILFLSLLAAENPDQENRRIIARVIAGEMEKMKHDQFLFSSSESKMVELVREFGGVKINQKNIYCLNVANLNPEQMKTWADNPAAEHLGLKFELYEYLPEYLYPEFSQLLTDLTGDIPRENRTINPLQTPEEYQKSAIQNRESGHFMMHFLLFDQENNLVGMTNVTVPNRPKAVMLQWMTGLKEEYRGKGLARWLKAKMLASLLEKFPDSEIILTDCYAANAPMIKINLEMGFTLETEEHEYLTTAGQLHNFLQKR
ncbi:MAG: GNAT family N-acetyltransferase [Bacteroidia bacterium]|nr:GNAT family N-acetyltransferase [Bacteroidia bacterium]